MTEHRRAPKEPISWLWRVGAFGAILVATIVLLLSVLAVAPAAGGVQDQGGLFVCSDMGCVIWGWAIGGLCLLGVIIVVGIIVPAFASSDRDLRGGLLTYYSIGVACLLLAMLAYAARDVITFVLAAVGISSCAFAVGCHVRLRRGGGGVFAHAEP